MKPPHRKSHQHQPTLPSGDIIIGRNAISEILCHQPERIKKIFVAKARDDKNNAKDSLQKYLDSADFPIEYVTKDVLDDLAHSDSHQSYLAILHPKPELKLKDVLESCAEKDRSALLFLDSIYDPQNLGSLLRTAECFGIDAVVWSKNRGISLTPSARKVSAGASELVNCIQVSNLAQAIDLCKEKNYWIVGADVGEGAESMTKFDFPARSVIVMGSEGEGLKDLVKKKLDFRVFIPMAGKIDSLNVAQAAAVMLYSWSMHMSRE